MSDEMPIVDPAERAKGFIADFLRQAKLLWDSDQFKELSARFSAVAAKDPNKQRSGALPKMTTASGSNFFFSAAIHGLFVGLWSEFELLLEILIMKYTGMSEKNTSIVCTPIQVGYKTEILISLLKENGDKTGADLVRKAQTTASRNTYIHGFWDAEDNAMNGLKLYYRNVKSSYTVRKKNKDWHDVARHLLDFIEISYDIQNHFAIMNEQSVSYKKSIEDLEPIHAARAEPHP